MQHIIVKVDVEIPNCPLLKAGMKVRVSNEIADRLVDQGLAKYDQGEEPKTEKAKKILKKEKVSK